MKIFKAKVSPVGVATSKVCLNAPSPRGLMNVSFSRDERVLNYTTKSQVTAWRTMVLQEREPALVALDSAGD